MHTHNQANTTNTHHGALDGGVIGAFTGHEGHKGHTGRDAALGAGVGHIAERHHEKHGTRGTHAAAAPVSQSHTTIGGKHQHIGLPVGTPGTVTTTTTHTVPKPSVGDKVSGQVDVLVGKLTHNPAKVQEGEIKKTQGKASLGAAGTGF